MANTPKAVRRTAKFHAEANRKGGVFGARGEKITESTKAWPKMSWNGNIKASNYVAAYAGRNSEFNNGKVS
jgi:hypothetical protein